jgi:hypothetical protein
MDDLDASDAQTPLTVARLLSPIDTSQPVCLVVVDSNAPGKRIGIVKRYDGGYAPAADGFDDPAQSLDDVKAFVNDYNARMGIAPDVARSFKGGSMFGWDAPIAKLARDFEYPKG